MLDLKDTITFGKYKGKTVKEIIEKDRSYITWAINNITWFELTKKAKNFLDKRKEEETAYIGYDYGFGTYDDDSDEFYDDSGNGELYGFNY